MKPPTTPGHQVTTPGQNFPQQGMPHPLAMDHHRMERRMSSPAQPPQQTSQGSSRRSSQDEGDLTAFNKLLSLMQAGAAAAVESPKLPRPIRPEARVPSPPQQQIMNQRPQTPTNQAQIAQNEFLQVIKFSFLTGVKIPCRNEFTFSLLRLGSTFF